MEYSVFDGLTIVGDEGTKGYDLTVKPGEQ
jgi:hypothetical protein